jgi:N-sulfoglucosamine sulfohydrolase
MIMNGDRSMTSEQPNVLIMHCHDLGRFAGCNGYERVRTPNIDRLAGEGVRFAAAFCVAPQCSPARSALFTGQYPQRNGVLGLTHRQFGWDLKPEVRHIGQHLSAAGYRTGLVGAHHESRVRPDPEVGERLALDYIATGGPAPVVAERAVQQLTEASAGDQPFYLQVGFTEPHRTQTPESIRAGYSGFLHDGITPDTENGITHFPYLHDDPAGREEIAELQGAVHYMDQAVGTVLDALDRLGLADNTIVIFTTDHGLALPRAKCSLYEPGLEVTLIARWPGGNWTGGRVVERLVSHLDVVPTVLEAAGIEADQDPIDGLSLAPLLAGGSGGRDEIFGQITYHDYYDPRRSVRNDRHKLIMNFSSAPPYMSPMQSWNPRTRAVVDQFTSSHPTIELYDLVEDPYETRDLAEDERYADVRDQLIDRLAGWMHSLDDPLLAGAVTSPLHRRAMATLQEPSAG